MKQSTPITSLDAASAFCLRGDGPWRIADFASSQRRPSSTHSTRITKATGRQVGVLHLRLLAGHCFRSRWLQATAAGRT